MGGQKSKTKPECAYLSNNGWKYDVFLLHTGEDISFVTRLYWKLCSMNILPFFGEETLEIGENAEEVVMEALQCGSRFVVAVLTHKPWREEEMFVALERHRKQNKVIIPVFYKITPDQYLEASNQTVRDISRIDGIILDGEEDETTMVCTVAERVKKFVINDLLPNVAGGKTDHLDGTQAQSNFQLFESQNGGVIEQRSRLKETSRQEFNQGLAAMEVYKLTDVVVCDSEKAEIEHSDTHLLSPDKHSSFHSDKNPNAQCMAQMAETDAHADFYPITKERCQQIRSTQKKHVEMIGSYLSEAAVQEYIAATQRKTEAIRRKTEALRQSGSHQSHSPMTSIFSQTPEIAPNQRCTEAIKHETKGLSIEATKHETEVLRQSGGHHSDRSSDLSRTTGELWNEATKQKTDSFGQPAGHHSPLSSFFPQCPGLATNELKVEANKQKTEAFRQSEDHCSHLSRFSSQAPDHSSDKSQLQTEDSKQKTGAFSQSEGQQSQTDLCLKHLSVSMN